MPKPVDNHSINLSFDLEDFIEASLDLICIVGYDGYFKKINAAVSDTLGFTREELYSRPVKEFMYAADRALTVRLLESIRCGKPLLNFENRYMTRKGERVWLLWTSVPVEERQAIFAIAKNITYWKKLEEYQRIAGILNRKNLREIFPADPTGDPADADQQPGIFAETLYNTLSPADSAWLSVLEKQVMNYVGMGEITIGKLALEMAMSERQLHRRIKRITGFSPNRYIRIIRLHLAREAIETGRYRTVSELSNVAGFETPAYFNRLFREVYGVDAGELLRSGARTDSGKPDTAEDDGMTETFFHLARE